MHFDLRLYLSKFQNTADFSDSFFYINFGINIILYTLYTPESVPIKYNAFFLRNHPAKPHTVLPPSKLYFARYFDEFQALLLCALHCSHFSGNKVLSCHTKCDALCHIRPVPCKIPTASKPFLYENHICLLKYSKTAIHQNLSFDEKELHILEQLL